MKPNRYRYISNAALRGFMRATQAWPICSIMRDSRLAVDAELTRRAIEEVLEEAPESWTSAPVKGAQ